MSAEKYSLHKSVGEVAKLEYPAGELVAEDSSVRGCLPGRSLKPTTAAICLSTQMIFTLRTMFCDNRFSTCLTKENYTIFLEFTNLYTIKNFMV
jgi:hypothetical protein